MDTSLVHIEDILENYFQTVGLQLFFGRVAMDLQELYKLILTDLLTIENCEILSGRFKFISLNFKP